eukprot:1160298-Pelagomonas_calceolata.AAC.2
MAGTAAFSVAPAQEASTPTLKFWIGSLLSEFPYIHLDSRVDCPCIQVLKCASMGKTSPYCVNLQTVINPEAQGGDKDSLCEFLCAFRHTDHTDHISASGMEVSLANLDIKMKMCACTHIYVVLKPVELTIA